MRFYPQQPPFPCGIDLHARSMSVCIVNHDGDIVLHKHMKAAPEPFLKAMAPYRAGLVVAVEGLFPWYRLAELCAHEGIACVLGHALSMKALHGGQAKNDKIASPTMAVLLRGGMLPQAYVSPAERRAARDLLRRRTHLMRQRAALLAHIQNTHRQYNLPEIGKQIAYNAHRDGGAARCADPAVPKNIEVDLALMTYYDELLRDLELAIVHTAKQHEAHTLSLLPTVPGMGNILSLVRRYAIHRIDRFPSVQECASYCRLAKCRQASGGKPVDPAGKKLGSAHLKGAFSEAAALFLRNNAAGQKSLARVEKQHAQGKALRLLAHTLGRAVSYLLKRNPAFALALFRRPSGRRAGALAVALATQGMRLHRAGRPCFCTASVNAKARRGP